MRFVHLGFQVLFCAMTVFLVIFTFNLEVALISSSLTAVFLFVSGLLAPDQSLMTLLGSLGSRFVVGTVFLIVIAYLMTNVFALFVLLVPVIISGLMLLESVGLWFHRRVERRSKETS